MSKKSSARQLIKDLKKCKMDIEKLKDFSTDDMNLISDTATQISLRIKNAIFKHDVRHLIEEMTGYYYEAEKKEEENE